MRLPLRLALLLVSALGAFAQSPVSGSDAERYDINANAPEKSDERSYVAVRMRLRALLEDRFKLRAHRDRRAMPVYALAAARASADLEVSLERRYEKIL